MQTNRLMIDLETLATTSDAAVVAIGAVVFDDEKVVDSSYLPLDLKKLTGRIDGSTLAWWFKQSPEAQQATFGGDSLSRLEPFYAGNHLLEFIERHNIIGADGTAEVWANDPDFDLIVLKHWWMRHREAYIDPETGMSRMQISRGWPFKYNVGRSYRTLRSTATILGWTEEMNGAARGTWLAHNAVEDAAAQARAVIAMRQFIANHIRMSI